MPRARPVEISVNGTNSIQNTPARTIRFQATLYNVENVGKPSESTSAL